MTHTHSEKNYKRQSLCIPYVMPHRISVFSSLHSPSDSSLLHNTEVLGFLLLIIIIIILYNTTIARFSGTKAAEVVGLVCGSFTKLFFRQYFQLLFVMKAPSVSRTTHVLEDLLSSEAIFP